MHFTVLTLFPELFESFLKTSLIARGISKHLIDVKLVNFRNWAQDAHKSVDDRPYGGGVGMVLRVDIIDRALSDIKLDVMASAAKQPQPKIPSSKSQNPNKLQIPKSKTRTILLTPQGKPFNQRYAERLAKKYDHLILVAGHYEGLDERVRTLVDEEMSIGDYVLTGGELPAMVVIDTVSRLVQGFLGKEASNKEESFSLTSNSLTPNILLEYPHYTRPEIYTTASTKKQKTLRVPKILLSGDHKKIRQWRMWEAEKRTQKRRPGLLA